MTLETSVRSDSMNEVDKYGFSGGQQYTVPCDTDKTLIATTRKREIKWLNMLENWNLWMSKKFHQIKKRCRKGIPSSLRGRAWQLLCGSLTIQSQNKKTFQDFLSCDISEIVVEEIDKDLHRQFPFHEMFSQRGGNGQKDLRSILHAYVAYDPKEGYCQAQAPVAAVLLMHMPAEEAFWCMVALFDNYIPGYYSQGLEVVQMDGLVMQGLLKKVSKVAYVHLETLKVSPMLYCTEWFMCLYARTLSWPCVLRVWDMFFCEGVKVLFQCGLVLLRSSLGTPSQLHKLPGLYETMECLRKLDKDIMLPDVLIKEITTVKISEADLEKEHKTQHKVKGTIDKTNGFTRRSYKRTSSHLSGSTLSLVSLKTPSPISVNSSQILAQQQVQQPIVRRESTLLRRKKVPPAIQLTRYRPIEENQQQTDVASQSSNIAQTGNDVDISNNEPDTT